MRTRRIFLFGAVASLVGSRAIAQPQPSNQTEITVRNVEEFFEAIGSNRTIKLKSGIYNLSNLKSPTPTKNKYFVDVLDGQELVLSELENLTIEGIGNFPPKILVKPRYADVLSFQQSQNITIKNIIAGHAPQMGDCRGGVLTFGSSKNIQIDRAVLFGSGTMGIRANTVENLTCTNSVIRECTYRIMCLIDSKKIAFANCQFLNNQEFNLVVALRSPNVTFSQCKFENNTASATNTFFNVSSGERVQLQNCQMINNSMSYLANSEAAIELIDTSMEGNTLSSDQFFPPYPLPEDGFACAY
jgi:hypothetical protein